MNKPRFVVGSYDTSPEHPSNWEVTPVLGLNSQTTLAGELREDVAYRKYEYSLEWEALNVDDYNALEEAINYALNTGSYIIFYYAKFPTAKNGTTVRAVLSSRGFTGGEGETNYLSSVTLTLTEVYSRL